MMSDDDQRLAAPSAIAAPAAVRVVRDVRGIAGAGFDLHGESQLDQFFNDLGYGRNPFFPCSSLSGNSDCERHSFLHHL
jgi:hypothetical protein